MQYFLVKDADGLVLQQITPDGFVYELQPLPEMRELPLGLYDDNMELLKPLEAKLDRDVDFIQDPSTGRFQGSYGHGGTIEQTEPLKQTLELFGGSRGTMPFVLEHGRPFKFDKSTFEGKRDKAQQCYANSAKIAMANPSRTYVEGYMSYKGLPIHHAWTVDKTGQVIDTTIKTADGISGYYGVPFQTDYVRETALKTGVWGVISHTNRDLFDTPPEKFLDNKPAQSLLELHDEKATVADVLAKATPKQREMIAKAEADLVGKVSTQKQYLGSDGKYTREREKLHEKILSDMFSEEAVRAATPSPGQKPVLTLTGGRPASGKTSALKKELAEVTKSSFYLSADTIQESLPGYRPDLAGLFNQEAQDISLKAEAIAMKAGLNLTYDATMKSFVPMHDRVLLFKSAGYDVDAYFVHTSPATSALRSIQRFEKTNRYVPPSVSLASVTNEKTFDSIIPEFRNWAVYDNNGSTPVWVAGKKS